MKKIVGMRKKLLGIVAMAAVLCSTAIPSLAANDVSTAMSSALDTLKSDAMGIILLALPVGLAIFGAFFAIRKGISLLRGIAGR